MQEDIGSEDIGSEDTNSRNMEYSSEEEGQVQTQDTVTAESACKEPQDHRFKPQKVDTHL